MTQPSAGATHWSKPSGNRFCERSAKAIGLSEALVERQLAWASRGRRWHTRWISWGSLGLRSETVPTVCLWSARIIPAKRHRRLPFVLSAPYYLRCACTEFACSLFLVSIYRSIEACTHGQAQKGHCRPCQSIDCSL